MLRQIGKGATQRATPSDHSGRPDPRLLREDHILCLMMDVGLAIHAAVKRQFARRRIRQALADLDEHQLRDIGVTRAEALRESECQKRGCNMSRHAHA